ncbi:hypothetical protein BCR41DRAFT_375567 [Lobosporangium transversale]|uniref:Uncharacterized protein n=1 Tax=Lobosporangium transversale TaxID=64571 RepID=A0A1Y2G6J4_9FUNG|nr:hypothetical protein BCR41DRAFT_375567 [Lobosporangium transversale]ORY98317.1 hypothetical protein BCR41DRAFT_375567 [Lobosporangium transversale]|eukprot:XP_021875728.1 hypothetical protein BCR41DRAFT_375567 [Lobosporangium transversale]
MTCADCGVMYPFCRYYMKSALKHLVNSSLASLALSGAQKFQSCNADIRVLANFTSLLRPCCSLFWLTKRANSISGARKSNNILVGHVITRVDTISSEEMIDESEDSESEVYTAVEATIPGPPAVTADVEDALLQSPLKRICSQPEREVSTRASYLWLSARACAHELRSQTGDDTKGVQFMALFISEKHLHL